jgi:hypothetical protein
MRAAWLIPIIVVIFSVVLISPRTGKADPADSKSVSDGETYNYHGTFNYYYPSPSPTPLSFSTSDSLKRGFYIIGLELVCC